MKKFEGDAFLEMPLGDHDSNGVVSEKVALVVRHITGACGAVMPRWRIYINRWSNYW